MHIANAFVLENYLPILQLLVKDFSENTDTRCAPTYLQWQGQKFGFFSSVGVGVGLDNRVLYPLFKK